MTHNQKAPCTGPVVEISVIASSLRDMDILSKSDPFVVLFVLGNGLNAPEEFAEARQSLFDSPNCRWQYYDETEVVWNDLSPQFTKRFILPDRSRSQCDKSNLKPVHSNPVSHVSHMGQAFPKEVQSWRPSSTSEHDVHLTFEVYDADHVDMKQPLSTHDFIGAVSTSLFTLLEHGTVTIPVHDKKLRARPRRGSLTLSTERYNVPPLQRPLTLSVGSAAGCALPSKDPLFYQMLRQTLPSANNKEPHFVPVYRSGAFHPPSSAFVDGCAFQDAVLTELSLTAGDDNRALFLELYFHKSNGAHVLVCRSEPFTIQMLRYGESEGRFDLYPSADRDSPMISCGQICITGQMIPRSAVERNDNDITDASVFGGFGLPQNSLSMNIHHCLTCKVLHLGSESKTNPVGESPSKKSSLRDTLRRASGRK